MRTNIVIDDNLVAEAMKLSQITTKRQVVEQALAEFVAFRKRCETLLQRSPRGHHRALKP